MQMLRKQTETVDLGELTFMKSALEGAKFLIRRWGKGDCVDFIIESYVLDKDERGTK